MTQARRFRFSGRVAPDDPLHQVLVAEQPAPGVLIPPTYVDIPGVGKVPQYAPTVFGSSVGYDPAGDCGGSFMSYRFQPNNNCYAYSCDVASNSFAQPGRMHGYLYPDPPTGPGVRVGAEKDGLVYVGDGLDDLRAHATSDDVGQGHYVALLISEADTQYEWPGDYHWARCDDPATFRSWSQKDGNDQVTDFDFAGQPIVDPTSANWTVNQGPISADNPDDLLVSYGFFAYMFVPQDGVNII
jgi:hypothetical protein